MKSAPEVHHFFSAAGFGGGGSGSSNAGIMFVSLVERKYRNRNQLTIMADLRSKFAQQISEAMVFVSAINPLISAGARQSGDMEFLLQGPDLEVLDNVSIEIMQKMRQTPGFTDVDRDMRVGRPEYAIVPDKERASKFGVPFVNVTDAVYKLITGDRVSYYIEGGKNYDVYMKLVDRDRADISAVEGIPVKSFTGENIDLVNLVDIKPSTGPNVINRTDRQRSVSISSNLQGIPLGTALEHMDKFARESLPEGYIFGPTGSSEMLDETVSSLTFAFVLATILTYMVMASQFESFVQPLLIMLTLPLGMIGSFGMLLALSFLMPSLPGMTLNMLFLIGLILLIGLVTKNAILLLDFTNQLRNEGKPVDDALLTACPIRLRPVMMTAFTTLAGAIPLLLGFGEGAESRRSMAVAIFGGMFSSTFLTLLVIPVLYSLMYDIPKLLKKLKLIKV